ncbi:uncharacterized protein BJ212DRAFT_1327704 [Suillus subaureus]|uniref:F-box domain-containing protein n=1 Tax=Suillus subaureus TaxID=48587 RepID=A0A9P7JH96_9AGAM|nr:uncharacterized protein BJ212DRAFT_1327704 [Suillus subaureus]KAG1822418.1 hypothetical protein BJ212DRAFT_1327704 [Suillus subaureus]
MTGSSYVERLPDDILFMIFKLIVVDEKEALYEYLQDNFCGIYWDDWGDAFERDSALLQSVLLPAASVCERWQSFLTRTPSMWTELQISFKEGPAALEHARKFVQYSGTCLLQITLLWDDPSWIVPIMWDDTDIDDSALKRTSRAEIMAALSFLSRPSVYPACNLEKLHLQFIHNPRHADHFMNEPSLFPGSVPPLRDLVLFGISWTWLSPHMLSSHLSDLRIHYDDCCTDDLGDTGTTFEQAKVFFQLLGSLVNLRTLTLELELTCYGDAISIELPHLHSLVIKSRSMEPWATDFLRSVKMPSLRILTLCVASLGEENSVHGIFGELATLTDPDADDPDADNPSGYLLELDELHLLNFRYRENPLLLHRLFVQMSTVETLTLGPRADGDNVALALALLPTPRGLPDLPFIGLRTLVVFNVPKHVMRLIVLERTPLAGPLEELYYNYDREDKSVQDDWQHEVEKYRRIGFVDCERVQDIVNKRWSYMT